MEEDPRMTESMRDRLRREIMAEWKDAMRRAILKHWMRDTGRDLEWVTQQISYTSEHIAAVLDGRRPMSETLTRACATRLGIDFGYVGVGKDPPRNPRHWALRKEGVCLERSQVGDCLCSVAYADV